MTFATIQTADTTSGTVTSNQATWTLTYPANIAANDLLIALMAGDGSAPAGTGSDWPAGWVFNISGVAAVQLSYAKKHATGSETGTFNLTGAGSEQGAWRIFRITGWDSATGIGSAFDNSANAGAVCVATTAATTGSPDPTGLNPNNWDIEDTLWIAACAIDTSRTISAYPLADNNTADVSGGSTGATLGICTANSAVALLDPTTFTSSASDDWGAATIGIRPGAPPAAVPRHSAANLTTSPALLMEGMEKRNHLWLPKRKRLWLPRPVGSPA